MKNKIKTRKAASKRLKKTGSGKWKMGKAAHNHLLQQKSKSAKRSAKKGIITDTQTTRIKQCLPYS